MTQPKKTFEEEILKEIERKNIRSYLVEKYGKECYNQAWNEIYGGISFFKRLFINVEEVYKRMREIFEERFKDVLK